MMLKVRGLSLACYLLIAVLYQTYFPDEVFGQVITKLDRRWKGNWVKCTDTKKQRNLLPSNMTIESLKCMNGGTCMVLAADPSLKTLHKDLPKKEKQDYLTELKLFGKIGLVACRCTAAYTGLTCAERNTTDFQEDSRTRVPDGKAYVETEEECKSKCTSSFTYCRRAVRKVLKNSGQKLAGAISAYKEKVVWYCECPFPSEDHVQQVKDDWCLSTCRKKSDCLNNGQCIPISKPHPHHECKCRATFTGTNCESSFSCLKLLDKAPKKKKSGIFKKIKSKLTGKSKSKKKQVYEDMCKNGGVCKQTNNSICVCPQNYTGHFCEQQLTREDLWIHGAEDGVENVACDVAEFGFGCKNGRCQETHDGRDFCDCFQGWRGLRCHVECDPFTYGKDCLEDCRDRHCADDTHCDPHTGLCKECAVGWANRQNTPGENTCDRIDKVAVTTEMILSGEFPIELSDPKSATYKNESKNLENMVSGALVTELVANEKPNSFLKRIRKKVKGLLNLDKKVDRSGETYDENALQWELHRIEEMEGEYTVYPTAYPTNDLASTSLSLSTSMLGLEMDTFSYQPGSIVVSFSIQFPAETAAKMDVQGTMERIIKDNADKYNSTLGPGYRIDKNSVTVSKPRKVQPQPTSALPPRMWTVVAVVLGLSLVALVIVTVFIVRRKNRQKQASVGAKLGARWMYTYGNQTQASLSQEASLGTNPAWQRTASPVQNAEIIRRKKFPKGQTRVVRAHGTDRKSSRNSSVPRSNSLRRRSASAQSSKHKYHSAQSSIHKHQASGSSKHDQQAPNRNLLQ